jgi:DNA polymerase-3 subunit beta
VAGIDDMQVVPDVSIGFETKKFAMQSLLDKAETVRPTRDIVPVLKNFQIEVNDDPPQIRVVATDMELSVLASSEVVSVNKPGVGVFPGQRLLELVREANDGDLVVEVDAGIATIRVGRATWTLKLLDGSDYPRLPDTEKVKFVEIDRAKFAQALASVRHAASTEAMRLALMLIDVSEGRMRAADGVRLQQVVLPKWPKALNFQLPVAAVDTLLRLLRSTDLDRISIGQTPDHLIFRIASDSYIATKLNAEFPDVDTMLLKPALANKHKLTVDREELESAIKRVRVTANPDTYAVVLELSNGQLVVKSQDTYGNAATEDLDCGWSNGTREIAFNHKHLLDMLSMADVKTCEFMLGDDTKTRRSPLLLLDEKSGLTSVLNQIRLDFIS